MKIFLDHCNSADTLSDRSIAQTLSDVINQYGEYSVNSGIVWGVNGASTQTIDAKCTTPTGANAFLRGEANDVGFINVYDWLLHTQSVFDRNAYVNKLLKDKGFFGHDFKMSYTTKIGITEPFPKPE